MQTGAPVPPKGQLLTNLAILITAPAPSILFCVILARCCTATNNIAVCRVLNYDPLILVNALFFVNVCVIFWVLSLVQGSTWVWLCSLHRLQKQCRGGSQDVICSQTCSCALYPTSGTCLCRCS